MIVGFATKFYKIYYEIMILINYASYSIEKKYITGQLRATMTQDPAPHWHVFVIKPNKTRPQLIVEPT